MSAELVAQALEAMGIKELDKLIIETVDEEITHRGVFRGFKKESLVLGAMTIPCNKITSIEGNKQTAIME
jgi:hypothetical protein